MSLDDSRNWVHAAALERGDMPPQIPEATAAERIASAIGTHLQPPWLTQHALVEVAKKVVAHRPFIAGVFADLDADPAAIGQRGTVLKQQREASFSDEDSILERLHELKAEQALLYGYLREMRSPYADGYEPDAVQADREDDRTRERRQDEAAREAAPRVAS